MNTPEKDRDQMPFIRIGTAHEQEDVALFIDGVFKESEGNYWTRQAKNLLQHVLSRLMQQCQEKQRPLLWSGLISAISHQDADMKKVLTGISPSEHEQQAVVATVNIQLIKWRASALEEFS